MRTTRVLAVAALVVAVGTFAWVAWRTPIGQGNAWDGAAGAIAGAVLGSLVSVGVALYVLHTTLANDTAKAAEERRRSVLHEAHLAARRIVSALFAASRAMKAVDVDGSPPIAARAPARQVAVEEFQQTALEYIATLGDDNVETVVGQALRLLAEYRDWASVEDARVEPLVAQHQRPDNTPRKEAFLALTKATGRYSAALNDFQRGKPVPKAETLPTGVFEQIQHTS